MTANSTAEKQKDLATRVFERRAFSLVWVTFLFVLMIRIFRPVQTFLLVCWVYGRDGYFQKGIRLLDGKPPRFSDGSRVPTYLDALTGFLTFLPIVFGLSLLLILFLRLYERHYKQAD